MKKSWLLEGKNHWSSEGYWASYSDLMAGVLLVFAVSAASAWVEFQARLVKPTEAMTQWQAAGTRLCSDETLARQRAISIDCSTGTLRITEAALRYDTAKTELPDSGKEVLATIIPDYLHRYLEAVCGQGQTDCSKLKGVEISGHTDATGSYQTNGRIGSERATGVLDYMMSSPVFAEFHPLLRSKAYTTGYADTRPPGGQGRRNDAWGDARRIEVQVHFDAESVLRDVSKVLAELKMERQ